MLNDSSVKCMEKFQDHWYKCFRDDMPSDPVARTSFKVLFFLFLTFTIIGLAVAVELWRSANLKHTALYLFYLFALLTLLCKYPYYVNLFVVRTMFFADGLPTDYLYPDWAYLLLSSAPTYTFLLCGLFY